MAVLVEGYSIIIKRGKLEDKFPGGLQAFINNVPNKTYCLDDDFVRVGFMSPTDFQDFMEYLENNGLIYQDGEKAIDFVVAHQVEGFLIDCNWAELVYFHLSGDQSKTVIACRKPGCDDQTLVAPKSWSYEKSLSNTGFHLNDEQIKANLKFIKMEGNIEVYQHRETGKYFYVGRTDDEEE